MSDIIKGYILCFVTVFGIIGAVTLMQKLFGLKGEVPRKLIHTLVSFTWFPMYFYLRGTMHFIVIPVIFTVVNYLAEKFHFFRSMEREREDGRHDWGTVYYAVCMTILSCVTYFFPKKLPCYGIAVFALSFGDGAAALIGSSVKRNIQIMKGKSLAGTIACFLAATAGIWFVCNVIGQELALLQSVFLGAASAVLELVSGRADNFAVSLGICALAWFMI